MKLDVLRPVNQYGHIRVKGCNLMFYAHSTSMVISGLKGET